MSEEKYIPRLKEQYYATVRDALQKQFNYANVHQIPKIEKIVVNMGVGEAATDSKAIDGAVADLRAITGQQPMITHARKSIATFHLRLVCLLALRLLFVAIVCGSSLIALLQLLSHVFATSVVSLLRASMVVATSQWV